MPQNPFTHPDFWGVAVRIAILLAVGALGVLLKERRLRGLASSTLFVRVRSWALIAPIFLLALFAGGFFVFLLAAFIALQGAAEYGRLVGLERRYAWLLVVWSLVGLLVAAFARRYFLFLPVGFFVLLTLVPIFSGVVRHAHQEVADTLFGYVYIGLSMAYLVFIKATEEWGLEFLLVVGLAVALSDVGAFVVGSILKGPRLAPVVSPNKTWSGAIGNLLGAALGVVILLHVIPEEWTTAGVVTLAVVVAVGALWGDLVESFIKRDFAVKDAGVLIPGFGGILDRADSLLFAMPLAYYALLVANRLSA